jgi:hypothetical protein
MATDDPYFSWNETDIAQARAAVGYPVCVFGRRTADDPLLRALVGNGA